MARVLVLLILVLFQGAVIVLLVNAPWVERQCREEQQRVEAYLGNATEDRIGARTRAFYSRWMVDTGVMRRSYDQLLPNRAADAGRLEIAPWFFDWIERRLDALWWLAFLAIYRAQALLEWLPYVSVMTAVATVDGLLQRQIRRVSAGYASADRYTFARRALVIICVAPAFYLILPFGVHPSIVPIWGGLLALTFAVFSANAQHEM